MRTTQQTATWYGSSGTAYEYRVYSLEPRWNDVPGNYILTKWTINGWVAIYVGETGSFSDRLDSLASHHAYHCARRNGVTHIHARINMGGVAKRQAEESDIRRRYNPSCNG